MHKNFQDTKGTSIKFIRGTVGSRLMKNLAEYNNKLLEAAGVTDKKVTEDDVLNRYLTLNFTPEQLESMGPEKAKEELYRMFSRGDNVITPAEGIGAYTNDFDNRYYLERRTEILNSRKQKILEDLARDLDNELYKGISAGMPVYNSMMNLSPINRNMTNNSIYNQDFAVNQAGFHGMFQPLIGDINMSNMITNVTANTTAGGVRAFRIYNNMENFAYRSGFLAPGLSSWNYQNIGTHTMYGIKPSYPASYGEIMKNAFKSSVDDFKVSPFKVLDQFGDTVPNSGFKYFAKRPGMAMRGIMGSPYFGIGLSVGVDMYSRYNTDKPLFNAEANISYTVDTANAAASGLVGYNTGVASSLLFTKLFTSMGKSVGRFGGTVGTAAGVFVGAATGYYLDTYASEPIKKGALELYNDFGSYEKAKKTYSKWQKMYNWQMRN